MAREDRGKGIGERGKGSEGEKEKGQEKRVERKERGSLEEAGSEKGVKEKECEERERLGTIEEEKEAQKGRRGGGRLRGKERSFYWVRVWMGFFCG